MYHAALVCLLLKGLFFTEPPPPAGISGLYTRHNKYFAESMQLHPDSTYRYHVHSCLLHRTDSGTYSYRHGLVVFNSLYAGTKDSLLLRYVIRSWHNEELWANGDKLYYKKTSRGYDLASFWVKNGGTFDYRYNQKMQIARAGVFDKDRQLTSGHEYIYDARDSLVEVKFIERGEVVKDSLLR